MEEKYQFYGKHLIAEGYGIEKEKLNNLDLFLNIFENGIEKANVTNCGVMVKKFLPNGITIVILLAESHISLHTYPEKNSLFLDIFTCGKKDPNIIFEEVLNYFSTEIKEGGVKFDIAIFERGKGC